MNKRICVGLMIDELVDDYAQAICQGASIAAREAGVELVTMPVGGIGSGSNMHNNWWNRHYNIMLDFPCTEMLDVLVISAGSIYFGHSPRLVNQEIKRFGDVPMVTIAVEFDHCSCVRFDNGSGVEGIVDHLVGEHGYRRVAYISGPIGNLDSDERLAAFRSAMNKHGVPVNEQLVVYGDFSENSRPVIERLLDEHLNDFDAVCCGNDCMALIVCQELERRGRKPGKDIAVTGYDNIPMSHAMTPSLTTVAAEAADLGYQAIFEAVRLAGGEQPRTVATPTYPLLRESCGCAAASGSALYNSTTRSDVAEAVRLLLDGRDYVAAQDIATGIVSRSWIQRIQRVIRRIAEDTVDPDTKGFALSEIVSLFRETLLAEVIDSDSIEKLHDLLFVLRDVLLDMVSDEDKKLPVCDVILSLQRVLSNISSTIRYSLLFEVRRGMAVMDSVRSIDETDLDGTLMGILRQLSEMKVRSSWVYLTQEPQPVSAIMPPTMPTCLSLRAYQTGGECRILEPSEGRVARNELLRNRYIPEDIRKNMILVPLFTYREQYGLLLCELPHEYFSHVFSVSRQISSVLETTHLLAQLNEQMDQMSLRYATLRNIASRDELTGCYNRRGFFEVSEHIARTDSNAGRRAIVAFADLDNLKQINDGYGHDEGDNALVLAAQALQKCFSPTSIIGRIGGDEYAVFDLIGGNETLESIHKRLKEIMTELDEHSGHPYHVSISAGLTEFQCNNEVVLRGYVDRADRQQYVDKKQKRTKVHKD